MGSNLKRRRPPHLLRPDQMLSALSSLRLTALLQHGGAWLALPPDTAALLDQCCTGQMDGGPGTAEEVAAVLVPLVGEPPSVLPPPAPPPPPQQPQQEGEQQQQTAAQAGEVGQEEAAARGAASGQEEPQADGGAAEGPCSSAAGDAGAGGAAEQTEQSTAPDPPAEGAGAGDVGAEDAGPSGAADEATTAAAAAGGGAAVARGATSMQRGHGRGRRGGATSALPHNPAVTGCRLVAIRLTLEEAFFLHHVLGCLQVYELQAGAPTPATAEHVQLLDTEGLWRACRAVRHSFVTSYVAYHHLKAKGWLPRSGLLYGVDYVVYQLHPTGAHSDFGVLVLPLAHGGQPAGAHAPQLGWLDLQITNRLINQVCKRLVLLYVYEAPMGVDHESSLCLRNFAVEERLVRRWVPDATRD